MRNGIFILHAKRNMLVICDKQHIRTWIGKRVETRKIWRALCRYFESSFRLSIPSCHGLIRALVFGRLSTWLLQRTHWHCFQIIFLVSCPVSWGSSHALILVPPRTSHMTDMIFTRLQRRYVPCTSRFQNLADYLVPVGAIEGLPSLWSATAGRFCVPATITLTIGPWTSEVFWVFSPTAWNYLPVDLWVFLLSTYFREKLKLYLFTMSTAHCSFKCPTLPNFGK